MLEDPLDQLWRRMSSLKLFPFGNLMLSHVAGGLQVTQGCQSFTVPQSYGDPSKRCGRQNQQPGDPAITLWLSRKLFIR